MGVFVGVLVGVAVGALVGTAVAVGVLVAVAVGVGEGVSVGVGEGVSVGVGVSVGGVVVSVAVVVSAGANACRPIAWAGDTAKKPTNENKSSAKHSAARCSAHRIAPGRCFFINIKPPDTGVHI